LCRFVGVALLSTLDTDLAVADSVQLQNGITISGEIVRYDEFAVTLQLSSGALREYPIGEILKVNASFCEAHRSADDALIHGNFAKANVDYRRAMETESRPWATQRIRIGLVRAMVGMGRWTEAAEQFLELAQRRHDDAILTAAPLVWSANVRVGDADRAAAQRWAADAEKPLAQLLAASWLVGTDDEPLAASVLERLMTHADLRISRLARAQQWRARLGPASPQELERFRLLVEQVPATLRAGPLFVLALAYDRSDRPLDAALAYLRVAFIYQKNGPLTAEALFRAAQAAQRAGLSNDAKILKKEWQDQKSRLPVSQNDNRPTSPTAASGP
jgi:hypothetical protein